LFSNISDAEFPPLRKSRKYICRLAGKPTISGPSKPKEGA
jgi:hypothetical protein